MVLLKVLHELCLREDWKLVVAHLNHQLRGNASRADERLVGITAGKLRLPLVTEKADVRRFAKDQKLSLEMAARKLRHDFLARTARGLDIPTTAVAHHAEDQLELFFLRLFRGSGGDALGGMKWRSLSPSDDRIMLVRPLLDLRKEALREFASQRNIPFREDASNRSLDFQRNRIRYELLPLLRRHYQKSIDKTILRVMDLLGAESDFMTECAANWLLRLETPKKPYVGSFGSAIPFEKLPLAMQRHVIHSQLLRHGTTGNFELVEILRLNPKCPVCAPATREMTGCSDQQYFSRDLSGRVHLAARQSRKFRSGACTVDLARKAGEAEFEGLKVFWRTESRRGDQRSKPVINCEYFDADRINRRVVLRYWRPGDRFQPIGMKGTVKLQDFFTNEKISPTERSKRVVATAMNGEIFWIEGLRISEQFKLSRNTKNRLQWKWRRA